MEPTVTFLERVNMLEGFKHIDVTYFDLEFESTKELYDLSTFYISEDPDFVEDDSMDQEDDSTVIEPNRWGPIDGRYFSLLEAEQINMCLAIKTGDIEWMKEKMFNPHLSSSWIYYNYALFKSVFAWSIPHFPSSCKDFNKILCKFLGNIHKINDVFYHFAWYVFPRILEHYTHVSEAIDFLIEAATVINLEEHVWHGEVDDVSTISLGRRPRPIFQLFWRWAVYNNYQESAFVQLFKIMERRDDPEYMSKLWTGWEKELAETRASALWEEPGRDFRLKPGPITYRQIKWNLPFHVFMNGNAVRFTPYIARACKTVFGEIPKVLYDIIELQCYYVNRHCKTMHMVYQLMKERFGDDREEYKKKIKFLQKLERTQKRVSNL